MREIDREIRKAGVGKIILENSEVKESFNKTTRNFISVGMIFQGLFKAKSEISDAKMHFQRY